MAESDLEAFMYLSLPIPPGTRQYTLQVGVVWVGVAMGRWAWQRVTFEAFMYLSLPIPPGTRRYTLQVGVVWVGVAMGRWAWQRVTFEAFMYLSLPILLEPDDTHCRWVWCGWVWQWVGGRGRG